MNRVTSITFQDDSEHIQLNGKKDDLEGELEKMYNDASMANSLDVFKRIGKRTMHLLPKLERIFQRTNW